MAFSARGLLPCADSQRDAPEGLYCPITLCLFQDPVFASDGMTYDREAIEQILRADKRSPITREPLQPTLTPNRDKMSDVIAFRDQQQRSDASPAHWPAVSVDLQTDDFDRSLKCQIISHAESTMADTEQGRLVVTHVELNARPSLWRSYRDEYQRRVSAGVPLTQVYVFHGASTSENTGSILRSGFRVEEVPGIQQPCGKGVYLAESLSYIVHAGKVAWNEARTEGTVLVARALLSNIRPAAERQRSRRGGDDSSSYYAMAVGGRVFAVPVATAVYPEFLLKFKLAPATVATPSQTQLSAASVCRHGAVLEDHHVIIQNYDNPVIEYFESPQHPCSWRDSSGQQRSGVLVGKKRFKRAKTEYDDGGDANRDDGSDVDALREDVLVALCAERKQNVVVHRKNVRCVEQPVSLPWRSRGVLFRHPTWSAALDQRLAEPLPGCSLRGQQVTAIQIFRYYVTHSIAFFFMGGAVRHTLLGDLKGRNDIDVSFGASPLTMQSAAKLNGFDGVTAQGLLVSWGSMMEGKPLQATAMSAEQVISTPVVSNDMIENLILLDFTCNTLAYYPTLRLFVDPCGTGAHDALNRILRIPVSSEKWKVWLELDVRKAFRYWKMRLLGYQPADDSTRRFLLKASVEQLMPQQPDDHSVDAAAVESLFTVALGQKSRAKGAALSRLRTAFVDEMLQAQAQRLVTLPMSPETLWERIVNAM